MSPLRIAFFGTPAFAVPTLDALLDAGHVIAAVITQPDRPSGRGQRLIAGAVKTRALEAGLPVLQPEKLRRELFEETFRSLNVDLGIVAAYGKILPQWLLDVPPLGMLNVHASLLPRYRGAAPVHRSIIAGETETGVTIMRVVQALDAGPMLDRVVRPIGPDDTSDLVERDLAVLGARLLVSTIAALQAGGVDEVPQDDSQATYASRIVRDDGRLEWSQSARDLHNRIRGLHPWPHAFTYLGGARVIVRRSTLPRPGTAEAVPYTADASVAPGTVIDTSHGRLLVVAGDQAVIELVELQAEGKRPMSARDFLAGRSIAPGQRFE